MRRALPPAAYAPAARGERAAQPQVEPLDRCARRRAPSRLRPRRRPRGSKRSPARRATRPQRLRAQQAAAAQAIEAAEARITASDAQFRLAAAYVAAHRERIAEEQRPVSSLLAGLAVMAQRPPLLALADRGGVDEFVKVSVLLDSTLPVIRSRTRALSAQLAEGQRLEKSRSPRAPSWCEAGRRSRSGGSNSPSWSSARSSNRSPRAARRSGTGDVAIAAGRAGRADPQRKSRSRSARELAALAPERAGAAAGRSRPPGRRSGRPLPTSFPLSARSSKASAP